MLVLGLNTTHDGSVALLRDGEIVCAVEEERLSRNKHHYGFPHLALQNVLEREGITFSDLDAVGFYWDPYHGLVRFLGHFLRHLPRSLSYVTSAGQQGIFLDFARLPSRLRRDRGFRGRFRFCRHHEAHCASAFLLSDRDEAAVLSVDGTGEWTTTLLAHGRGADLRVLRTIGYPHSLGKVYEALTQYLGFKVNSGEGKVMGLSSYGKPTFRHVFDRILRPRPDGGFRVDKSYFAYHLGKPLKYSSRLVSELGPVRVPESELDQRHADIARSLQDCVGDAVLRLCHALHRETGSASLCLAGGVGHNSVINGRILRETPFEHLFVQPAAHDSGAALGAALLTHAALVRGEGGQPRRPRPLRDAFLGPSYGPDEERRALEASGLSFRHTEDPGHEAALLLARGEVVGWFQGRMEYGPRALGHRSILADPRTSEMKDLVNRRIKFREPFRPFAFSVLLERVRDYFDCEVPSPFMLLVYPVRNEAKDLIPAVVHTDGTCRLHTVSRDDDPLFHRVLSEFEELTGVAGVLNTSFNRRGEPMVCSPEDAIRTFEGSGLDALFLGSWIVRRRDGAGKGGRDAAATDRATGGRAP